MPIDFKYAIIKQKEQGVYNYSIIRLKIMNHFESFEDYLERILMLSKINKDVKAIDIAKSMNYSKASISIALKKLRNEELIIVNENGNISLTNKGLTIANNIYERHMTIASILMSLGVPEKIAYADSCKIEHDISVEGYEALKNHFKDII